MSIFRFIFNLINNTKKYRYLDESYVLGQLAAIQLNSDKNKIKEPLENSSAYKNASLCINELYEVIQELKKEKIDHKRVLEEVGDAAAYLVGVIACVKKQII